MSIQMNKTKNFVKIISEENDFFKKTIEVYLKKTLISLNG